MKKRLIAIHLPQFHPFKENDEWWGKGFTEWSNVAKARPRFREHYQPHIPTDLGFYDLRLEESRIAQAKLAKEYGIYGFCYYHYWFNGKQLMERPVNEILSSGKPDFPFMLCWANENWARNWDGGFQNVLIEQNYTKSDDIAHMEYLCKNVFVDDRYIKINGKPFFIVYKPFLCPDIKSTLSTWRDVAKKFGFDLYLGFMRSGQISKKEILEKGFDVSVDFQPDFFIDYPYSIIDRIIKFGHKCAYHGLKKLGLDIDPSCKSRLYDYRKFRDVQIKKFRSKTLKEYPCVTPRWDNSPRRVHKLFDALINENPKYYEEWLDIIYKEFSPYSEEENFIFINAWNEWAEGNHLEPDTKWGDGFLKATQSVIERNK